jgi:hypothetical protein
VHESSVNAVMHDNFNGTNLTCAYCHGIYLTLDMACAYLHSMHTIPSTTVKHKYKKKLSRPGKHCDLPLPPTHMHSYSCISAELTFENITHIHMH